ncbi:hypothetical protein BV210_13495 [Halorientalis sp. IM1011]|uniref:DUF5778 family protein n=1 Tax=Halorientalis sp. IM1011 TaxID=1932360 RepID=UPI00097CC0B9|nr:DUF5778 family protein [Halorientalis sp. IM1011]AQL43651.1 hypothetical protein BV210_13495 [Halorientalis sp. IM1011]
METEDPIDPDLYQRAEALLEPGEIELVGIIVHTELGSDDEASLHETTIEIGEHIADHAGVDPKDTYVYSGNDDAEFGLNQHQGRTLDGDEFVWECQQLLREEEFKVVFYYEADTDQEGLVEAVREDGYTVEAVSEPA